MPAVLIILEYKNIDIVNIFKFAMVKICIATNNNKKAKEILISIVLMTHRTKLPHINSGHIH